MLQSVQRCAVTHQLDPANAKSVEQVQAERAAQNDEETDDEQDHDDDDDDEDDNDDKDIAIDDDDNFRAEEPSGDHAQSAPDAPVTRRASISELRERLHSKIEALRRKRNPSYEDASSGKQALLDERRRQRGEMRDKERQKRTEARKSAAVSAPSRAPGLLVPETKRPAEDADALSFSQVSFNTAGVPDAVKKSKFALSSDPKTALAMLEARKRREAAKAQRDEDGGEAREEAHRWDRAIAAAEGVKIHDNEALLKQTIKRREKSKAKSAKAWSDRRKAEEDAQAAKQKKRMENITARRSGKKGKAAKPRPGFEGAPRALGGSRKGSKPQKR